MYLTYLPSVQVNWSVAYSKANQSTSLTDPKLSVAKPFYRIESRSVDPNKDVILSYMDQLMLIINIRDIELIISLREDLNPNPRSVAASA